MQRPVRRILGSAGKVFGKKNVPIEHRRHGCHELQTDAPTQLLEKLYSFLTGKKITAVKIVPEPRAAADEPVEQFYPDSVASPDAGMRSLHGMSRAAGTRPRVTQPVSQQAAPPTVQFTEVQVKPAEKPPAQLRASIAESVASRTPIAMMSHASFSSRDGTGGALLGVPGSAPGSAAAAAAAAGAAMVVGGVAGRAVLEVLSQPVDAVCLCSGCVVLILFACL